MQIQRFEVGPFAQNTYLLWDDSRHSVLIDAGFSNDREFDMLFEFLEKHNLDIDLILLTHAHVDHILGLYGLFKKINSPLYHFKKAFYGKILSIKHVCLVLMLFFHQLVLSL